VGKGSLEGMGIADAGYLSGFKVKKPLQVNAFNCDGKS